MSDNENNEQERPAAGAKQGYHWDESIGDNRCDDCGGVRLLGSGHHVNCPFAWQDGEARLKPAQR